MTAEQTPEDIKLIGAGSLEVFTHIVNINPQIAGVNFWTYVYRPIEFTEPGQNPYWVSREELLSQDVLPKLVEGLPDDAQVGVFSKVKLANGETAHIAMMDFSIPKGNRGIRIVKKRVIKAGLHHVWLFETEESYHLYGRDLFPEKEWVQLMGIFLLTSLVHTRENIEQVADPRYIGHSLIRGGNVLRVTTRGPKQFKPKVVAFIP